MKLIKTEIRVIKKAERESVAVIEDGSNEMSNRAIEVAVALKVSSWLDDFTRRKRARSREKVKLPKWAEK